MLLFAFLFSLFQECLGEIWKKLEFYELPCSPISMPPLVSITQSQYSVAPSATTPLPVIALHFQPTLPPLSNPINPQSECSPTEPQPHTVNPTTVDTNRQSSPPADCVLLHDCDCFPFVKQMVILQRVRVNKDKNLKVPLFNNH